MQSYNCVIVEDNDLDRAMLETHIARIPFLTLEASFSNPIESLELVRNKKIDVFFLDIDMPGMNGIDFQRTLPSAAVCIFTTVHPEYAVEAFNTQALDYLLKPVTFERLHKSVNRAAEVLELRARALLYAHQFENESMLIKEGTAVYRLNFNEIIYLEALTNYTKIVTRNRHYMTLLNLKNFMERLPTARFLRIHRSYAVAVDKIQRLRQNELVADEWTLPLGKTYKGEVKQAFNTYQ
ncbi:MAG TPA: LytTR family DNA-binding domain-containing protein [Chitinophagaceae bacterium]|nr:LytTR family DNA-binding domain-containing protein [Chitinophagaceae bacterium]